MTERQRLDAPDNQQEPKIDWNGFVPREMLRRLCWQSWNRVKRTLPPATMRGRVEGWDGSTIKPTLDAMQLPELASPLGWYNTSPHGRTAGRD
ncbi:MAG: hypothetical protein ACLQME_20330 [Alphaproteobacteria bacterium]